MAECECFELTLLICQWVCGPGGRGHPLQHMGCRFTPLRLKTPLNPDGRRPAHSRLGRASPAHMLVKTVKIPYKRVVFAHCTCADASSESWGVQGLLGHLGSFLEVVWRSDKTTRNQTFKYYWWGFQFIRPFNDLQPTNWSLIIVFLFLSWSFYSIFGATRGLWGIRRSLDENSLRTFPPFAVSAGRAWSVSDTWHHCTSMSRFP